MGVRATAGAGGALGVAWSAVDGGHARFTVALAGGRGEQPGQRDLRRRRAGLGGDSLDLIDDTQIALEVLPDEAGIGLAPVVDGDVVDAADLAGKEAVAERGV